MRKYLSLAIIGLMLSLCFSVSSASSNTIGTLNGTTLYVDEDGTADYTKIQDAIDNATDGYTVFVYSGTYYENLVITTHIILVGENKNTTIIDGSQLDDVIKTDPCGADISNFTIQNSSGNNYYYTADAGVSTWGNSKISNNIFRHNKVGITAGNDNILIENNEIKSCWQNGKGIFLINTNHNNIIANNEIANMPVGIEIWDSNNDTIKNNKLYHNDIGIKFSESSDNPIIFNDIFENNHGIYLDASHNNYIYSNNINSNTLHGILFELSNNNSINKNLISYTIDYPTGNHFGLYLENSSSNTISRNIIEHNTVGTYLDEYSDENTIYNNDFYNSFQSKRNANDDCGNYWDNGTEGNYWDDYTGTDGNGDGIGDTPYNIEEEIYDNYPLISESSWNALPSKPSINSPFLGNSNESYDFFVCSTDSDNDVIYYQIDWGDGDIIRVGPFESGYTFKVSHKWTGEGNYEIEINACNFDYIHYVFEGVSNKTVITIDDTAPTIHLLSPENALYFHGNKIKKLSNFDNPIIIGYLIIKAEFADEYTHWESLDTKLYIDGELVATNSTFLSYYWAERYFLKPMHTIKITATDLCGNINEKEIDVWKFF